MSGPPRPPPRPRNSTSHTPYDPRQYSQAAPPPPPASHPIPTRNPSAAGPQPYNPAAYQDNSIANAANQIYGPAATNFPSSPNLSFHTQSPASSSPYSQFQSHYGTPQQPQYGTYAMPASPRQGFPSPAAFPLPPRSVPNSPALPPPPSHPQSPPQSAHRPSQSAGVHNIPSILRPSRSPEYQPSDDNNYSSPRFGSPPENGTYDQPGLHLESFPQPPTSGPSRPDGLGIGTRHPRAHPLPGPPQPGNFQDGLDPYGYDEDEYSTPMSQQDLFAQVEDAVMGRTSSYSSHQSRQNIRLARERPEHDVAQATAGYNFSPASSRARVNGAYGNQSDPLPARLRTHFDDMMEEDNDDDSDAEATAGLEAMRMAEEQETVEENRRSRQNHAANGITTNVSREPRPEAFDASSPVVDLGMYGGDFEVSMSYGGDSSSLANRSSLNRHQHSSSSHSSMALNEDGYPIRTSSRTSASTRPTAVSARVDEAGTGGLADPNEPRRMSFDEDDEVNFRAQSENQMTPEIYYQPPSTSGGRPLPVVPQGEQSVQYLSMEEAQDQQYFAQPQEQYPSDPSQIDHQGNLLPHVPRSQSLGYQSHSQYTVPTRRAKTDAEERKRMTMIRASTYGGGTFDSLPSETATDLGLDLPSIPATRRFQPSKLSHRDFDQCSEPWAIGCLIPWLRRMAEGETELKEYALIEALVNLFTHKVSNLNIADAESLGARVVNDMLEVGTLVHEEEWLRFGPATTSGVLFQLTGQGCYAQRAHDGHDGVGRCYAHYCQRTVRKAFIDSYDPRQADDWVSFYQVGKEDLDHVDKKEIERQNNLHEIVQSEYKYMENLKRLRILYKNGLETAEPSIIPPKSMKTFLDQVFGKLDPVQKANEDYLLPQLRYRQQEQGPWIVGFSDIFRDWIRKAKTPYIEYAANFPNADFLFRQEARRNVLFTAFLEGARNNKLSEKLPWDNFLKAPITKLQRYGLLLTSVYRNMKQETEEKQNLQTAIDEIVAVTKECDGRFAEMSRKVKLLDLQSRLILRPEMKKVDLNLTQWGRELFFTGDLQRTGQNRFTWLDTFGILLDNYLVLSKTVSHRDSKSDQYDVSKMPIPMDLLLLESGDDDPVVKSSMKGIAAVSTVTAKTTTQPETRLNRSGTNQSPRPGLLSNVSTSSGNSLTNTNSSSCDKTLVASTTLSPENKDDNILYPFRLRHLGKELYTLFASSAQSRKEWCDKIVEAKTKHASALFAQNAEPFRLRVLADSAFVYDGTYVGQKTGLIKGTPLHRAIVDVESAYSRSARPAPICRTRVNCATSFTQPDGTRIYAIGTEYGVYLSEAEKPRGWTRVITMIKVSQMAVLEEFRLFLIVSDKSLIAYHLDVICPPSGQASSDASKKPPQKLSGNRDIGFFATGRMKDRTLIFYEKREGRSSIFKILEPVYQKSNTHHLNKSRRFFSPFSGSTEFFRDFDEFYIPADCTGINLFNTTVAIATNKGFEVLTLDKKTAWSVPEWRQAHVASIAQRVREQEPVAMFRLAADGHELLCVYSECAVYVNKYGEISRSVVLEFVGKAKEASLIGGYLVLFDPEFVEVRDALNGRLKQIIAGRDVRCLDNGSGQAGVKPAHGYGEPSSGVERSIKFALQHPEQERSQLIMEMILDENERL